jgi:hypothetical protein
LFVIAGCADALAIIINPLRTAAKQRVILDRDVRFNLEFMACVKIIAAFLGFLAPNTRIVKPFCGSTLPSPGFPRRRGARRAGREFLLLPNS